MSGGRVACNGGRDFYILRSRDLQTDKDGDYVDWKTTFINLFESIWFIGYGKLRLIIDKM